MLNIEARLNTVTNTQPAYFGQGTRLTVLEPNRTAIPPTVRVLKPSPNEGGQTRTLVCVATEFYPDHVSVSWTVNGNKRLSGVATDAAATRLDDFYRITSRLTVYVKEWQNRGKDFACVVDFFNGTETVNRIDSIRGVKGDFRARGKYLRIAQNAKLAYCAFIVKSCVYGAFVVFLLWKLQKSRKTEK